MGKLSLNHWYSISFVVFSLRFFIYLERLGLHRSKSRLPASKVLFSGCFRKFMSVLATEKKLKFRKLENLKNSR